MTSQLPTEAAGLALRVERDARILASVISQAARTNEAQSIALHQIWCAVHGHDECLDVLERRMLARLPPHDALDDLAERLADG